jgi:asparagine synthetase B (glutamine-hydrolysing)
MICDGLALTYNSESFNYLNPRGALESADVRLRGLSDVRVIPKWRHWGIGRLSRQRGRFAFAMPKALIVNSCPVLRIDDVAVVPSLLYYMTSHSWCMFRGGRKPPPSTRLRCRPNVWAQRGRFWSARAMAQEAAELAAFHVHPVVAASTRGYLVADVPAATWLSQGCLGKSE